MGTEIERKFLVDVGRWQPRDGGTPFRQGYLSSHPERTVRVRLEGEHAVLTIKGLTRGISRTELEYPIPRADAEQMLAELCEQPLIDKHRHVEVHAGVTWEIDVFHGANAGLVIAEVELESDTASPALPPWIGRDVSADPRYYNANLVAHPYSQWQARGD